MNPSSKERALSELDTRVLLQLNEGLEKAAGE
jgi:hypothetical protein